MQEAQLSLLRGLDRLVSKVGRPREPGAGAPSPRLGRPSERSLRDVFASPDPRPLTRKLPPATKAENQPPELCRDRDVASTATSMNGGQ